MGSILSAHCRACAVFTWPADVAWADYRSRLMIGFSIMSYFDRTIMSIAGPQIMKEFDLSPTQMGSVYSPLILSYATMMIPAGHVADRLGPRLTLLLMGLAAALFTASTALGGKP